MKRLIVLAVTAVMALALSACGDNAQKKSEVKVTTEQTQPNDGNATPTSTTTTTTTPESTD